jgi:hypothetical protein
VGEIGISRDLFLYGLKWWEINSILRGYRKRKRLTYQLLAENIYASTYAFRGSEGKTVKDMFPSLFEDEDDYEPEPPLTEDDRAGLLADMAVWNAQHQGETQ